MTPAPSSEHPASDRIRAEAARILGENPDFSREELRAALEKVFLPPKEFHSQPYRQANAAMVDLGLVGFVLSFRHRWATKRNKTAIEFARTAIEAALEELFTIR